MLKRVSTLQKLTILEFQVFDSSKLCTTIYGKNEKEGRWANENSNLRFAPVWCKKWAYRNFVSQCRKFCRGRHNNLSQCRKFCGSHSLVSQRWQFCNFVGGNNVVSQCRKFVGYILVFSKNCLKLFFVFFEMATFENFGRPLTKKTKNYKIYCLKNYNFRTLLCVKIFGQENLEFWLCKFPVPVYFW